MKKKNCTLYKLIFKVTWILLHSSFYQTNCTYWLSLWATKWENYFLGSCVSLKEGGRQISIKRVLLLGTKFSSCWILKQGTKRVETWKRWTLSLSKEKRADWKFHFRQSLPNHKALFLIYLSFAHLIVILSQTPLEIAHNAHLKSRLL